VVINTHASRCRKRQQLTFTPFRYPQIWSPSPYFDLSMKNSSIASLL
jgi:hypothetical protein